MLGPDTEYWSAVLKATLIHKYEWYALGELQPGATFDCGISNTALGMVISQHGEYTLCEFSAAFMKSYCASSFRVAAHTEDCTAAYEAACKINKIIFHSNYSICDNRSLPDTGISALAKPKKRRKSNADK